MDLKSVLAVLGWRLRQVEPRSAGIARDRGRTRQFLGEPTQRERVMAN
jgi:hypothetical protein